MFYEGRTFSRGGPGLALDAGGVPLGDYLFAFDFGDVAVEVCEDAWSPDGPMRRRCYSGAEIVVNVSSSPYRMGIDSTRREMLATRAADNQAVLLYANAVGGQDGLIYDGGGFIFQNGRLVFEAPRFEQGWWSSIVDLDRTRRLRMENTTWRSDCEAFRLQRETVPAVRVTAPTADRSALTYPSPEGGSFFLPASRGPAADPRERALDDLFEALALGVKSYYEKTGAFKSLGIALSGGRDSMLTLLVAWRASQLITGGAAISAFYMPSRHSQPETRTGGAATRRRARRLAQDQPHRRSHRSRSGRGHGNARRPAADRADTPEHPGARSRTADVELGQLVGRAVPADRRHEREGRRLHHHWRRPRGRAVGDCQRAEDGGDCAARTAGAALRLHRACRRRCTPIPDPSWPMRRSPSTS